MRFTFIVLFFVAVAIACTAPTANNEKANTNALFFCKSKVLDDACKKNVANFSPKTRVYIHLNLETIPENMQVEGKLYFEQGTNLAPMGSQAFDLRNVEDVKFIDFIDIGTYQVHIVNSKGTLLTQGRVTVG